MAIPDRTSETWSRPPPIDRGQPSVFITRRSFRNAFTVSDSAAGEGDLTWTVKLPNGEIHGPTTATARFPRNCITSPAAPSADLVLQKNAPTGNVPAGRRLTYTIQVLNRGPNIALKVRIVDTVDPRLKL